MTKQEREIIYKACEMIETGEQRYSCCALRYCEADKSLLERYEEFYRVTFMYPYWPDLYPQHTSRKTQSQRILMLLLFAEAESDVTHG